LSVARRAASTISKMKETVLKNWYLGRECDVRNRDDILAAVRKLAEFHKLTAGYKGTIQEFLKAEQDSLLQEYERHNRELNKVKNYIRNKNKKNEFEMLFMKVYESYKNQAREVTEQLKKQSADLGEEVKKQISLLKLRKLRRELHEASDVEAFLTDMLIRFKNHLLEVPAKLAMQISGETDMDSMIQVIKKEMLSVLEELSDYDQEEIDGTPGQGEEDDFEEELDDEGEFD